MRFLVDNQLPKSLADFIRQQGHESDHVLDLGMAQSKDDPIWQHAIKQGFIIVTKDEDYVEWVRRGRPGPAVVWIRKGNCTRKALLSWITPLWSFVIRRLEEGARLVEVR